MRPLGPASRTLGALALLGAALPANVALTAAAAALGAVRPERRPRLADPRTVLITGGKMTKALHLARCFHRAGHRVVLVESDHYRWSGHRSSRCVDVWHTTPVPGAPGWVERLLEIIEAEGVDVFVPVSSPASSLAEAELGARLPARVLVVHGTPEEVGRLDDKERFMRMAAEAGLPVPDSHRITDPADAEAVLARAGARRYILKRLAYDPVARLDLTPLPRPTPEETAAFVRSKGMSPDDPWILQELLDGVEHCTHSTVRDGVVGLHICCESSAWQLNYRPVDRPDIADWVRRLVEAHGLTGQISLDLIVGADGVPRAIECNPRTHSAITVIDDPGALARAYLGEAASVEPRPGARPTYWAYHEAWRALRHPTSLPERVVTVVAGRDAIWDPHDPLPFLMVHHRQIPLLLLDALVHGRDWVRIDCNIGKLVEPAGD